MKNIIDLSTTVAKIDDIDVADLNGEKVMMNLETGQYFVLNDVGSRIWELIEAPITVNEVINKLLVEYDVDYKSCKEAVMEFLTRINYVELIKIS